MSDTYICVIPTQPDYVPPDSAREAASRLFAAFVYPSDMPAMLQQEIEERVSADPDFIHGYQYLDRVSCPCCGRTLPQSWWTEAMDAAYATCFRDLRATVPCCDIVYSLNDLVYDGPAGFARYVLRALYPSVSLTVSQLDQLGDVLGCPLRQIWQRI